MSRRATLKVLAAVSVLPLALTACSSKGGDSAATTEGGKTVVSLWTHSAGNATELDVLNKIISDYNASQSDFEVKKQDFPQDAYNDSVQGAAASNDLPCILDVDGPIMPNWAWNGWMVPTGLTDADVEGFLPSTVGKYKDEIYSVGYWEATTMLFSRKSILDSLGIRVATVDKPWTAEEFADAQKKIKASGKFANAIDYGVGDNSEWWSYAFSPLLQSFGGDLINRDNYESADGVLNGDASVKFATWFQDQFKQGYSAKSNAQDRTEFEQGKVALQYSGVWAYAKNSAKFKDLVMMPAPDFGNGSKAGAGSWQYGLSKSCTDKQKEGALAYLKFSLDDKYLAEWSDVTSLIPVRDSAAAKTAKGWYGPGKPLEVATQIAAKNAVVRPVTPGYPVISQVFRTQLQNVMNGTAPKTGLDQMVTEIDSDIKSAGYQK